MTQIIPCNIEMYAVYGEGGEEFKSRIIAFGIDNTGNLRPIVFDSDIGCDYADDACNLLRYELIDNNRIADSLEDISESLRALSGCVCEVPLTTYDPGYTFFRIGGSVDTDTL